MSPERKKSLKIEAVVLWTSGKIASMIDLYNFLKENNLYRTNEEEMRAIHFSEQYDSEHPDPSEQDMFDIFDCMVNFIEKR